MYQQRTETASGLFFPDWQRKSVDRSVLRIPGTEFSRRKAENAAEHFGKMALVAKSVFFGNFLALQITLPQSIGRLLQAITEFVSAERKTETGFEQLAETADAQAALCCGIGNGKRHRPPGTESIQGRHQAVIPERLRQLFRRTELDPFCKETAKSEPLRTPRLPSPGVKN